MKQSQAERAKAGIGPLAFPHFVGPGIKGMTTALLYHGKLAMPMPGWLSQGPLEVHARVHERAFEIGHPLAPLLNVVGHHFKRTQIAAMEEVRALAPLRGSASPILMVAASTQDAYLTHGPWRWKMLPTFHQALADEQILGGACVEFLWRCWEIGLENGANPDDHDTIDPDVVLSVLMTQAKALGNPELLLAECALHRHILPAAMPGLFATDSPLAAVVTSSLNDDISGEASDVRKNPEALSFFFFDQVLQSYALPLSGSSSEDIARLMRDRSDALQKLRDHCRSQALDLLASPPRSDLIRDVIENELRKMKEAAAEVANADSKSISKYFAELSQDEKVWGTVSGLLGFATSGAAALTASFGVAALAVAGSKAVKVRQERQKTVSSSPYSFVYYANRVRA